MNDCRQEFRWLYARRDLKEAQQGLQAWLQLPRQHHKHLKSINLLERLNEEIKRRTRVVSIFPNPASCLQLVRALCAETHDTKGGWRSESAPPTGPKQL